MSDLAVQVSELTGDDDRFVSYKQAVFAYLSDFMARFDAILPAAAGARCVPRSRHAHAARGCRSR